MWGAGRDINCIFNPPKAAWGESLSAWKEVEGNLFKLFHPIDTQGSRRGAAFSSPGRPLGMQGNSAGINLAEVTPTPATPALLQVRRQRFCGVGEGYPGQ